MIDKKALWEAVKEPLRLLVLGVISYLIVYVGELNMEWGAVALVVLRFLDKYLHELGKTVKSDRLTRGITQF